MEYLLGKEVALEIKDRVREEIKTLPRAPKLVILLNENDLSSEGYVRAICKNCESVSIDYEVIKMEQKEEAYLNKIKELNDDESVDGVLITRPLDKSINENKVLASLKVSKDVDATNPLLLGRLLTGDETLVPNTALAMIRMLEYYKIPLKGKKVLVVGRSLSVGKPMALLLLNRHATVTIAHSRSENLDKEVGQYDIVIAAVGKKHILKGKDMKEGAIVIDAGIHYLEDGIFGDVEPDEKLSAISKVPGGVGTITSSCLMENVLACYKENHHD